ncbi:MAG: hypothetical protein RAP03_08600, partial [Candidatus Electryonea clarkiae]|nr:hypothetical protein [Candidatus Electryonea clarkiae]
RIFPAFDINRSGTRKEERILEEHVLNRVWILRNMLSDYSPMETMKFVLDKMRNTDTNEEFLMSMSKGTGMSKPPDKRSVRNHK